MDIQFSNYWLKITKLIVLPLLFFLLFTQTALAGGGTSVRTLDDQATSSTGNTAVLTTTTVSPSSLGFEFTTSNKGEYGLFDILIDLIWAIVGGALGFGTVILVDWLKEPQLIVEKGSEPYNSQANWKFIHLKVKNKARKFDWLPISTLSANAVKALIKLGDKEYIGRWTSKAEPLIYGPGGRPIGFDPSSILITPREDIHPSTDNTEVVEISIGIKSNGQNNFYAFNNESYLYQPTLKNTKRQFGLGIYHGELILSTAGKKFVKKFKVFNTSSRISDFKLEMVN